MLGYLNQLLTLRRYQIKQILKSQPNEEIHVKNKKSFIRNFFNNRPKLKTVILGLYASVFSMYGNCMLFLLPVSYGIEYAICCLILFKLITLRSLVQIILNIISINSEFHKNKISWK